MRSPTWTRLYTRDPILKGTGRPSSTVYHKPMDVHPLLHSTSSHPPHTTYNIAFAQALRYKKICSEPPEYELQIKLLENIFIKRGYLLSDIRRLISRALCRSRVELLTRAPPPEIGQPCFYHYLPPTHGPNRRHSTQIYSPKPDLHQVFREPPIMTFRRGKNLRDLLVSSKFQQ